LNNEDIHTETAEKIFSVSEENVTMDMRRKAKEINFGIIYGMSEMGLSRNLKISRKQAQEYIENYFANFPGVKKYLNDTIYKAENEGYVQTILGRRRYIPDINSQNKMLKQASERMAVNAPIQGSSADIIKLAMININSYLEKNMGSAKLLLQIHDELVFEAPVDKTEELKKIIKDKMENVIKLSVPLKVAIKTGNNLFF